MARMIRTQILLAQDEIDALDRARRATGASRSELIRRAIQRIYGEGSDPASVEERLAGLRAARGIWKDRPFTGQEYERAIRSGDMNANLRRLGVE